MKVLTKGIRLVDNAKVAEVVHGRPRHSKYSKIWARSCFITSRSIVGHSKTEIFENIFEISIKDLIDLLSTFFL